MSKVLQKNVQPKELAKIFLTREFIKLFNTRDKQKAQWIEGSMKDIERRIGEDGLWNLLSEINDFKMKGLFHILTDDSYQWTQEEIPLSELTMTGLSAVVDPVVFKNDRNYKKFAQYWHAHPEFQKKLEKLNINHFYEMPERDHFPIFVHESKKVPGELVVFDGMRRSVVAALRGDTTTIAYVGRVTKKGKPHIQQSTVFHLNRLFHKSNRDTAMQQGYMRTIQEIANQFSNGKQLVKNVIQYPSRDEELMELYRKVFSSTRKNK